MQENKNDECNTGTEPYHLLSLDFASEGLVDDNPVVSLYTHEPVYWLTFSHFSPRHQVITLNHFLPRRTAYVIVWAWAKHLF